MQLTLSEQANSHWLRVAARMVTAHGNPLYRDLALAIAVDRDLQTLTHLPMPNVGDANVFFGAVHHLILDGAPHEFAALVKFADYSRINDAVGTAGIGLLFRDFVQRYRAEIGHSLAKKSDCSNLVARSACLRAGYCAIASLDHRPMYIIEIGAAAGLNLLWDRYAYAYQQPSGSTLLGGGSSTILIDCEVRGPAPPVPSAHPDVLLRIGIDRSTLDLSTADDRSWLFALVSPLRPDHMAATHKAVQFARQNPPSIQVGDASIELEALVRAAPHDSALVVTHSMTTSDWSLEQLSRLEYVLTTLSESRAVWRLFQDRIYGSDLRDQELLRLRYYNRGTILGHTLAQVHADGDWINWLTELSGVDRATRAPSWPIF